VIVVISRLRLKKIQSLIDLVFNSVHSIFDVVLFEINLLWTVSNNSVSGNDATATIEDIVGLS